MRDCVVTMKDGSVYAGSLWVWRPLEGYMELVGVPRIYLRDVVRAVIQGVMTRWGHVEDVDQLARARAEGWDGT